MISLERVSAKAGDFRLSDVCIDIAQGGFGVVIGPAGSGKTTLLETIAGVIRPTSGRIFVAGADVTSAPPEKRRLGIVYQHGYLFPHLTVRENIQYGAVTVRAAEEIGEQFGVGALGNRSVASLSGGERQLVAIARALARQPDVLLLDEPFSALDPRTRNTTRRLFRAVYYERRFTVLQVTHDFAEAGLLGDTAVVLNEGRVVQQGDPADVFRKPASPFIADFLGAENVFAGTARRIRGEDEPRESVGEDIQSSHAIAFTSGGLTFYAVGDIADGPAHAVIRAEEVLLSSTPAASSVRNQFAGRITEILGAGPLSRISVDAGGVTLVAAVTARSVRELGLQVGSNVVAGVKATAVHLC